MLNVFTRASGSRDYGGLSVTKKAKEIYDQLIERIEEGVVGDADSYSRSCFLNCCNNMHGTGFDRKEALVMAVSADVCCVSLYRFCQLSLLNQQTRHLILDSYVRR